ncbi:cytochrome-c peroxidase [Methylocapsa polymorpha]|uniref:Cytochrome-c peroxidase n=1 Tax=Methylocapsa polymorpha TaxID=3080828 RepID=A0ABZ0HVJ0_9HYPH|nr:cytochrome-c peroxidase [Methylocapsa sp. RX1]
MVRRIVVAFLSLGCAFAAPVLADEDLLARSRQLFSPIPSTPPELPGNSASPAKVELGKTLYFDPRLSASHAISCSSCHNLGLGGADAQPTSIGHHWQRGGRNAPTVLNSVFNLAQFWDGRAKDLEEQAGGPVVNPIEMASQETDAVDLLKAIPGYHEAFAKAFPGEAPPITLANAQKAIAVFEATLITPNAPFDRFLKGDAKALSPVEKQGLALFLDKGCADCHNGINIGGGMYARFGQALKPGVEFLPPDDKGRAKVTKADEDEYVYKVPTLRNIALTAPYFHTGKEWDLRKAVALMGATQLGEQLSKEDVDKLTAFLGSLTGDQPKVTFPTLPPNGAATPQPAP